MSEIAWYPFYVGDYARKTAHLSLLEHGAYRLLIDHYYSTRLPLPSDPVKLYRICRARTPSERKAVLSTAAEFFAKDGTLLRNKKCDSELNKQLKYRDSQSAKAKLRHSHGNATALPRAPVPQPQPQEEKKESKETPIKKSADYFHLPEWIPKHDWDDWLEVRKRKKAPNTKRALNLALSTLEKLYGEGNDPAKVLQKSIMGGYPGLYPVTTIQGANYGKPKKLDLIAQGIAEARAKREQREQGQTG